MRSGIVALVLAYVLSQFYRAFLAVLAPTLAADLQTNAQELAQASGWWFLTFALMQVPVGWALDKIGPRRTTAFLLAIGAGGAAGAAATVVVAGTALYALLVRLFEYGITVERLFKSATRPDTPLTVT